MSRILIFSTAYLPFIGGAEVAIKEISDRSRSFEFDMITARLDSKLPKYEQIGRINVYRIGLGWKLDKFILPIFGTLKAIRLNRGRNYEIIWSMMASQASVAASFFKMASKKKLLLTLQEGDLEEHLERYVFGIKFLYKLLIKPWHRLVFKMADRLTVISQDLKKRALTNKVRAPIDVVPNGVDLKLFAKIISDAEKEKVRTEIGKQPNDIFLIHSGRIVLKNGLDDVVASLPYLPKNIKFLVMGDGADRSKLEQIAKQLQVADRVIFYGKYYYDILPKYFAVSDIFIRPSRSEGQGISFLEAMAARVPIIGTPVGGIVDFLRDEQTGVFCRVGDPRSIADSVRKIIENQQLRNRLVEQAAKLVREKYDWNKIVLDMEQSFNAL